MLRRTAASVIASVSLFSPAAVQAEPVDEQAAHAIADSAAQTYKVTRDEILLQYREQTVQAQLRLAQAADPAAGWREYRRSTQVASRQSRAALIAARETFRRTVEMAREQSLGDRPGPLTTDP